MKEYKMYTMIIDDGKDVYKVSRIAKNLKSLKNEYSGNGEFVKITDTTEQYPISELKVIEALKNAGFGEVEIEAVRTLLSNYVNVVN